MNYSDKLTITVGIRDSLLSRAQMQEVWEELRRFHPQVEFQPIGIKTTGDKDLNTSLRFLDKTDFFTKEIDQFQLARGCRISIHSAKDLPKPLAKGLVVVALTKGVDPSDVIVLREKETLQGLPFAAKIGTSSLRREQNVKTLRHDLTCVDIRGSIQRRLALLDEKQVDGVVMAVAALIRLQLTHRNRILLPGERAPLQGQLAVVALENDQEMRALFHCIDSR